MTHRRRIPMIATVLAVALAVLAGCNGKNSSSSQTKPATQPAASSTPSATPSRTATLGFEGIPLEQGPELASAGSTAQGKTVDGIKCGATEQLSYHIHAHLAVYDHGAPRALPAGIGIPGALVQQSQYGPVVGQGQCFYWLHTHTADGVVHIESPTSRIYTLGNFFDEWGQVLSQNQVGPSKGSVAAFVNGKPWRKDLRSIPLDPHAVIQLDVGAPATPFHAVSFSNAQL